MNTDLPLVSVIIPAYNRKAPLLEAMESVARQTYPRLELIVVDDGSTEDIRTPVVALSRQVPFPVFYYRQENSGPGIARRTGLQHARGEYIQYLDSDDEILPHKIERQVEMMLAHPEAVMCYTITQQRHRNGSTSIRTFSDESDSDLLATALQYRRWGTPSCLWRYGDKTIAHWTSLYLGEDVVHDVSVGLHNRNMVFLSEIQTIVNDTGEHIGTAIQSDPIMAMRYLRNTYRCPIFCLQLLRKHGLDKDPKYAEPLAERFFFAGYTLAKFRSLDRSVSAFQYVFRLSRSPLRRCEAAIGIFAALVAGRTLSRHRAVRVYRLLYRLHRRLVPPSIHCYRQLGSALPPPLIQNPTSR